MFSWFKKEKKMTTKLAAINLAIVKENAIKWYKEGRLTAQHPDKDARLCVNNGKDGYRCAVAASYPEDFPYEGGIFALEQKGVLLFPQEEKEAIVAIQSAHDRWAQPWATISGSAAGYEVSRLEQEIEFLRTLI